MMQDILEFVGTRLRFAFGNTNRSTLLHGANGAIVTVYLTIQFVRSDDVANTPTLYH